MIARRGDGLRPGYRVRSADISCKKCSASNSDTIIGNRLLCQKRDADVGIHSTKGLTMRQSIVLAHRKS